MRFQPGDTVRMFGDEGIVLEVIQKPHRQDYYFVDFGALGELVVSELDLEPIPHLSPKRRLELDPEDQARALRAWIRDNKKDDE